MFISSFIQYNRCESGSKYLELLNVDNKLAQGRMEGSGLVYGLEEASNLTNLQSFLEKELSFNMLLIENLRKMNYPSKHQKIWLDISKDGQLRAVLLKHYGHYYVYATSPIQIDSTQFVKILRRDRQFETLSGRKETVEQLCVGLRYKESRPLYVAELEKANWNPGLINRARVQRATLADAGAIMSLKKQIAEFQMHTAEEKAFRDSITNGSGRCYIIRVGDQVISSAATMCEQTGSAMIVDVCTHPDYRNKGYATLCLSVLCQELLGEQRHICLFYESVIAGSLYKKLGFVDIGSWLIITAERRRLFSFRHV